MENSFANWATIVCGFAGLVSAVFVAFEKFTKGPKILCEIRKAIFNHRESGSQFDVTFDLGNSGTEMTTLKKAILEINELSFRNQSYDVHHFKEGISFQIDDCRTYPILPGEALVLNFKFFRKADDPLNKSKALQGKLHLEFLSHRNVVTSVELKAIGQV